MQVEDQDAQLHKLHLVDQEEHVQLGDQLTSHQLPYLIYISINNQYHDFQIWNGYNVANITIVAHKGLKNITEIS